MKAITNSLFLSIFMVGLSCIAYAHREPFKGAPPTLSSESEKAIRFEENKNQHPNHVLFKGNLIKGGEVFLEKNAFTYSFWNAAEVADLHHPENDTKSNASPIKATINDEKIVHYFSYKTIFLNANLAPEVMPELKETYYRNYFLGNDASKWAKNVAIYNQINYKNLYPNIDMKVYSSNNNFEYDFIIKPNGNANDIQLFYEGTSDMHIKNGALIIPNNIVGLQELQPIAYQLINGVKTMVLCEFKLHKNIVSFYFPKGYNQTLELIIDPILVCSSYIGSISDSWAYTATYDELGNIYAGGIAASSGYPITVGAIQNTFGGGGIGGNAYPFDICITKFNPNGSSLLYSTYLGGSNNEQPGSIIVDKHDDLFILGRTYSSNFPVTAGSFDNSHNGGADLIVSKFNSTGTSLLASTYVGGSEDDGVNITANLTMWSSLKYNYGDDSRCDIMVDTIGNCYIAACTKSVLFPTTPGAFQQNFQGGGQDGCVFKMDASLSTLMWSTYLGGNQNDAAYYLDLDSNLNVYVTGGTASLNFPITAGAYHTYHAGGLADGFITRISNDGASIMQSTFIGTVAYDQSYFVQLDAAGEVYICGQTEGAYPVSNNVYKNPNSGQFIHKFNPTLSTTLFSTVFGSGTPHPNISPSAFLVDDCKNIYVAGWGGQCIPYSETGTTTGLPVTANAVKPTTDGCDFYFIVLKKNAQSLWYATFFGGNTGTEEHVDGGTSRFDKKGIVYQSVCSGCGGQSNFPTTPGVWSSTNNSANCNIAIIKMDFQLVDIDAEATAAPTDTVCLNYPINFTNNSTGALSFEWNFGDGTATSSLSNPSHLYGASGVYDVMLIASDSTSCNEADTSNIQITVIFEPVAAVGNDTIACGLNNLPLNAGSAGNYYLWSTGETTQTININESGIYYVQVSNDYCSVSDSILVTVVTPPPLGSDTTACTGDDMILHADNPGCTYLWSTGEVSESITVETTGVYWVVATAGGCSQSDTLGIYYYPLPHFDLGSDTTLCPRDTLLLNAQNQGATYIWSTSETAQFINISTEGLYWATVDNGHCINSDSIRILYYQQPTLGIDTILCSNTKFKLDLGYTDPGGLFLWNTGATTTAIMVADAGKYWVDLTYKGCVLSDTVEVATIEDKPPLFIPNSFTPNADGLNDIFFATGGEGNVLEFSMKIYDRWGHLIFETTDLYKGWNGMHKNDLVPLDVYIYMINYNTVCSPETFTNKVGHVLVLK